MAAPGSTPVGQERRPLCHRRKRTIPDSNGQKQTPPLGAARDGVWCGWLAECDGWQYACRAGEKTPMPPETTDDNGQQRTKTDVAYWCGERRGVVWGAGGWRWLVGQETAPEGLSAIGVTGCMLRTLKTLQFLLK